MKKQTTIEEINRKLEEQENVEKAPWVNNPNKEGYFVYDSTKDPTIQALIQEVKIKVEKKRSRKCPNRAIVIPSEEYDVIKDFCDDHFLRIHKWALSVLKNEMYRVEGIKDEDKK